MKFFGRTIVKKVNKYTMVIILFIEIELLDFLYIAKKTIYLLYLIKVLILFLSKIFIIK